MKRTLPRSSGSAAFGLACSLVASLACARASAQEADLLVEASVTAIADPDTDVSFSVTLTNGGPDAATTVTLSDPLPAGLTFVSLVAPAGWSCATPAVGVTDTITCTAPQLDMGASASFTIVAHVDGAAAPGTYFTNIVSAQTGTFDPNSENDASPAVVQTPPPPPGDLFVTLEGPSLTIPDQDVAYAFAVTNAGSGDATNVTFTQSIPDPLVFVSFMQTSGPTMSCVESASLITCTAGLLASGAVASFALVVHVPSDTAEGTTFQAFATVSSDADPNGENDQVPTLFCVQADQCVAGPCNNQVAVVCPAPEPCHDPSVCEPVSGGCPPIPSTNGTPCDDASVCTVTDTCQSGACTGAEPLVCDDADACTFDACDPLLGCSNTGGCDAGTPDAGNETDAGAESDAGTMPDAGSPPASGDEGCGCRVAGGPGGGAPHVTLVAAALLVLTAELRRRRARRARPAAR